MIADHDDRYYEEHPDIQYEILRSIVVEDHESAWCKFTGTRTDETTYEGYSLMCECDFQEGVGWKKDETGQLYGLAGRDRCMYRDVAVHLRHLELRKLFREKYKLTTGDSFGIQKYTKRIITSLIALHKEDPAFFIGERGSGAGFWGGYFYLQTVAAITDQYIGHLWEPVWEMVNDGLIGLDGAVIQDYVAPPPPKWEEWTRLKSDDGFIGVAMLPGHRKMAQEWKFTILSEDGKTAFSHLSGLRLSHDPIFGPDVEDIERAEKRINTLFDTARRYKNEREDEERMARE